MPQRPKEKPIRFDEHINVLLEICLRNFFGGQTDRHDMYVASGANLCWLIGRLSESSQFTTEQQALLKQIVQTWNEGFHVEPLETDEEE